MTSRMSRSSHGGKPFSANRTRVEGASKTTADGQKYPEIKQRGFYSDIIGTEADVAVSLYIEWYTENKKGQPIWPKTNYFTY